MFSLRADKFIQPRTKPLPFIQDRAAFQTEWLACLRDPARPTDQLYTHLADNIEYWVTMLVDPTSERTIEYFSLVGSIGGPDPDLLLNEWVELFHDEIPSYIWEAYTSTWRSFPFKKLTVGLGQWCYIISRMMRRKLRHLITASLAKHKRLDKQIALEPYISSYSHEEITDLHIRVSRLPNYQYYLISLYLIGYDRNDYERVTYTTSSFVYLWRTINDFLKEKDPRD